MKKQTIKSKEKGQSLVELAISLPVIVLILLGSFDFGMALFSYSIMRDAAQEGALYASFAPGNKAGIESRARNILIRSEDEVFSSPIDLQDKDAVQIEINIKGKECQGATKGTANYAEIKVVYDYPFLMPFIETFSGSDTLRMSATASNVILQPPCK